MKRFEIGSTYRMGWIGDSDLVTYFKVLKRTELTVQIEDQTTGEKRTCRIQKDLSAMNKAETVKPYGSYSMAPSLHADWVA